MHILLPLRVSGSCFFLFCRVFDDVPVGAGTKRLGMIVNEFSIESTPETVVVRSAGPNGIHGDADDITQEWTPDTKN